MRRKRFVLMNLDQLETILDKELLSNTYENRQSVLLDLKRNKLELLIDNIIKDETQLLKIASQSYLHPNGFDKILLIDRRPKYALRLHLWNPKNSRDGHIHNHEWDLSGIVIKGSYEWKLYEYDNGASSGSDFYCYECVYDKKYKEHTLIKEKKVKIKKIFDINISENSFYNLSASVIHKITATDKFSASLVIHGNNVKQKIKVISKEEIEKQVNKKYQYYLVDEIRILLEDFLQLLRRRK